MAEGSSVQTGKVKWFSDSLGYGFIVTEEGVDVFVHFSECPEAPNGFQSLREGQSVCFEAVETPKGFAAEKVALASQEG
jgi:cold shock protein